MTKRVQPTLLSRDRRKIDLSRAVYAVWSTTQRRYRPEPADQTTSRSVGSRLQDSGGKAEA
jgi:hypothetical protein